MGSRDLAVIYDSSVFVTHGGNKPGSNGWSTCFSFFFFPILFFQVIFFFGPAFRKNKTGGEEEEKRLGKKLE